LVAFSLEFSGSISFIVLFFELFNSSTTFLIASPSDSLITPGLGLEYGITAPLSSIIGTSSKTSGTCGLGGIGSGIFFGFFD